MVDILGENKTIATILGAIIVGLVGILLLNPLGDYMEPPNPLTCIQENDEVVFNSLTFNDWDDYMADFRVTMKNVGDDGDVFVTISSNQVLSRYKDRSEFDWSSSEGHYLQRNEVVNFDYKLYLPQDSEFIDNFTIYIEYYSIDDIHGYLATTDKISESYTYQKTGDYTYSLI
ncbi:hypothetical protein RE476_03615 [Methanolobus mangrovi]|uniref:DUF1616 domain-containing protein n=1 Tax=Methanolobus mangrovi TaxID=3072977 RepID=A0AA51YJT1_9EURY|nr:hypothetical protein [Methanolobus mangrovi]WMW22923.1 hypothetical protein RE476_03615 [Methanolobus mangrovi]